MQMQMAVLQVQLKVEEKMCLTRRIARLALRCGCVRNSSGSGSGSPISRRLMPSCSGSIGRGPRRSTTYEKRSSWYALGVDRPADHQSSANALRFFPQEAGYFSFEASQRSADVLQTLSDPPPALNCIAITQCDPAASRPTA